VVVFSCEISYIYHGQVRGSTALVLGSEGFVLVSIVLMTGRLLWNTGPSSEMW
jgi:hypothetical protein